MTAEFAWYDVCDWTRSVISVPRSTTGNSTFPWALRHGVGGVVLDLALSGTLDDGLHLDSVPVTGGFGVARFGLRCRVDVLGLVHGLARGDAVVHVGDVASDGVDPGLVD